jgi:DNA adenine methylase
MGGKYYLTGWLSEKIPEHVCYVEPFCGAGHLLFDKRHSAVEVLNDIDNHLVNFFRVIQVPEKRQALIDRLAFMPYSRSIWREVRTRWKQGDIPHDEIEQAAEWFYLNRTTFSGDQRLGGFACPSITGRNPAQSYFNAIDGLEAVAQRLRGVTLECLDFQEVIQRYDSPDTLFYCDPPYLDADKYYRDYFSLEDHRKLSEILHSIQAKAMISHYECATYNELYMCWNKYIFRSFKGSSKSNTGQEKPKIQEVLYTNFKPPLKNRSLFNAL